MHIQGSDTIVYKSQAMVSLLSKIPIDLLESIGVGLDSFARRILDTTEQATNDILISDALANTIVSALRKEMSQQNKLTTEDIAALSDSIRKSESSDIRSMLSEVKGCQDTLIRYTTETTHTVKGIKESFDTFKTQDLVESVCSTKIGERAELRLLALLENKLSVRDQWDVSRTSKSGRCCDISVKNTDAKLSRPFEVSIECKAYRKNVNKEEIKKFYRDISNTQTHGIFVSLTSGIANIGNFEMHQIGAYYVIFLSNNEYDADSVVNCIHLLRRISELTNVTDE